MVGRWVWCFKERGGSERGELKVEVEKERERRDTSGANQIVICGDQTDFFLNKIFFGQLDYDIWNF